MQTLLPEVGRTLMECVTMLYLFALAVGEKSYKFKIKPPPPLNMFYTICLRTFFANIIGLPGHRNTRKSVLEITKMYYF